jgi:hypothetical protein
MAARTRAHNKIVQVFRYFAESIGLTATTEPSSSSLLLGQYTEDATRILFTKCRSIEARQHAAALSANMCAYQAATTTSERDRLASEYADLTINSYHHTLSTNDPKQGGLRVDLAIECPNTTQVVWIDASRNTQRTHRTKALNHLITKHQSTTPHHQ